MSSRARVPRCRRAARDPVRLGASPFAADRAAARRRVRARLPDRVRDRFRARRPDGDPFVPMLFVLPLGLVPFAVAGRASCSRMWPRSSRAASRPSVSSSGSATRSTRSVRCWSWRPSASAAPTLQDWPIYVLALAAQFAFEFASAATHERIALGRLAAAARPLHEPHLGSRCGARSCWLPGRARGRRAARGAPARAAAHRPPAHVRARAARRGSTMRSSSVTRIAAPRSCSATSSRPTTPTPACTASDVVSLSIGVAEELGLDAAAAATPSSWRCSTTSARSGSRTRSSTSRGR